MDTISDSTNSRFFSFNAEVTDEVISRKNSGNTLHATQQWIRCFDEYLEDKSLPKRDDIEDESLPSVLQNFYAEVRNKDGNKYKTSSLRAMRAALSRYFKHSKGIEIITNDSYTCANDMFRAIMKINKSEGKGSTSHYPSIENSDLNLLSKYFRQDEMFPSPKKLQQQILFNICHFCRKGRDNLRIMTVDTFKVRTENGVKFIEQVMDEMDKNYEDEIDEANHGRIYQIPGANDCPVFMFELYIKKLHPKMKDLWQRPKERVNYNDPIWFYDSAVGKDTLGKFMATLSYDAQLSKRYTNHSIRATCVTVLDEAGFEALHMSTSSHKYLKSIQSYGSNYPKNMKREMMPEAISQTFMKRPKTCDEVVPFGPTDNYLSVFTTEEEESSISETEDIASPCTKSVVDGICRLKPGSLPTENMPDPNEAVRLYRNRKFICTTNSTVEAKEKKNLTHIGADYGRINEVTNILFTENEENLLFNIKQEQLDTENANQEEEHLEEPNILSYLVQCNSDTEEKSREEFHLKPAEIPTETLNQEQVISKEPELSFHIISETENEHQEEEITEEADIKSHEIQFNAEKHRKRKHRWSEENEEVFDTMKEYVDKRLENISNSYSLFGELVARELSDMQKENAKLAKREIMSILVKYSYNTNI